jgi:hypothetical protein
MKIIMAKEEKTTTIKNNKEEKTKNIKDIKDTKEIVDTHEKEKTTISSDQILEEMTKDIKGPKNKTIKSTSAALRHLEFINISNMFHSHKKTIFYAILIGIVMSFITTFFVNASGLFSLGVSGLSQGISYTIERVTDNNGNVNSSKIQTISF